MSEKGHLEVTLDGNQSGFQQMLNSAKVEAKKFSQDFSGASMGKSLMGGLAGGIFGALSIGALKDLVAGVFDTAKSIRETSEQFDLSIDSVQKWEQAITRAGLSTNTFFRALEMLRAKRQEERDKPYDPNSPFARIGVGREARDVTVSDEAMLKMILTSGASRALQRDVLGPSGPRLGSALQFMPPGTVFSEADIEQLTQLEGKAKSFWLQVKGVTTATVLGLADLFSSKFWNTLSEKPQTAADREARDQAILAKEEAQKSEDTKNQEDADHLATVAAGKKWREESQKLQNAEAQQHAAERRNMTTGDRRQSTQNDLSLTNQEIAELTGHVALSVNEQVRLAELKTKAAGYQGELREHPLNFAADNLAKVGLYGASSVSFNPVLGVAQQQLSVLHSIDHKIGTQQNHWKL